jgi:hypothetical protein
MVHSGTLEYGYAECDMKWEYNIMVRTIPRQFVALLENVNVTSECFIFPHFNIFIKRFNSNVLLP